VLLVPSLDSNKRITHKQAGALFLRGKKGRYKKKHVPVVYVPVSRQGGRKDARGLRRRCSVLAWHLDLCMPGAGSGEERGAGRNVLGGHERKFDRGCTRGANVSYEERMGFEKGFVENGE